MKKYFLIFLVIIIFMTLPTWQFLSKSSTDDETIEEAITRLIGVHNLDSTSHTDTGASLDIHRTNPILDHPAGAAVGDKQTMSEFAFRPSLTDSNMWQTFENNSQYDESNPPGVDSGVFDTLDYSFRVGNLAGLSNWFDWSKDMLMQVNMALGDHTEYIMRLGYGGYASQDLAFGFGFEIVDDVLKGFYVGPSGKVYTGSIAFSPEDLNNLRAQYTASLNELSFYLNGELAETLIVDGSSPSPSGAHFVFGMLGNGSSADASFFIFDIYFVRGV